MTQIWAVVSLQSTWGDEWLCEVKQSSWGRLPACLPQWIREVAGAEAASALCLILTLRQHLWFYCQDCPTSQLHGCASHPSSRLRSYLVFCDNKPNNNPLAIQFVNRWKCSFGADLHVSLPLLTQTALQLPPPPPPPPVNSPWPPSPTLFKQYYTQPTSSSKSTN